MQGDWFLDLFTAEAEKLVQALSEERVAAPSVPTYWWVKELPQTEASPGPIAAVDGGGALQPVVGGGAIYLVRAFGLVGSGPPERCLELKLLPVRDSRTLDAMRAWVEHRAASRALVRLERGAVLLMDGSFWVLVTACISQLVRVSKGKMSSLGLAYSALYSARLLISIVDLVVLARRQGVILAYVSKDHGFRVLKEKVLLDFVSELAPDLRRNIEESSSYYPLAFREKLVSALAQASYEVRRLLASALDPCYRDPAFLEDVVGASAGYTWAVSIPPPYRIVEALRSFEEARNLADSVCSRVLQVVSEHEADVCHDVDRLAAALMELPGVMAFYVKPSPTDHPLLIEVPDHESRYFQARRTLKPPTSLIKSIVALITREYGGPEYYNIPLVLAHMYASIRGAQMDNYMKLLESLASAKGVRISLSRRWSMRRLTLRKPRRLYVRRLF